MNDNRRDMNIKRKSITCFIQIWNEDRNSHLLVEQVTLGKMMEQKDKYFKLLTHKGTHFSAHSNSNGNLVIIDPI